MKMQDIQIAAQIYFIGIVIATIMAGIIRGLQVTLSHMGAKKKEVTDEGE